MAETWLRIVSYTSAEAGAGPHTYPADSVQETMRMLEVKNGFRGGHWGYDEDSQKLAAITNWDSREAIEAVLPELDALHEERARQGLDLAQALNLRVITGPTPWPAEDWDSITSRESRNWLRVVSYRTEPAEDAATVDYLRTSTQSAIHLLAGLSGFRVGYWGHDALAGSMAAITYWDGKESIEKAAPELDRLHEERKQQGVAVSAVLNLELLHTQVMPAGVGWLPKEVTR